MPILRISSCFRKWVDYGGRSVLLPLFILQNARIYSGVPGKVPGWRSAVGPHCKFNWRAVYMRTAGRGRLSPARLCGRGLTDRTAAEGEA